MNEDNHNRDKASTPSEFNREYKEGVLVTLSSGKRVRLRTVGTLTFLKYGKIPDYITPHVEKLILSRGGDNQQSLETLKDIEMLNELMDIFCCTCIVEPKVVDKLPEDCSPDEVSVHVLSDEEKGDIFGMLGKSTRYMQAFFRQQEAALDTIYNLQDVLSEAEQRTGNKRTNKKARTIIPAG